MEILEAANECLSDLIAIVRHPDPTSPQASAALDDLAGKVHDILQKALAHDQDAIKGTILSLVKDLKAGPLS